MPEPIVPSQYASTSSFLMPDVVKASVAESTSRSSALLSQCSPKGVQPMPTMATLSRMPCDAMSATSSYGTGLPEVIVHTFRREEATEAHLDPITDLHGGGIHVGELALVATSTVEVDHTYDHGRRQ